MLKDLGRGKWFIWYLPTANKRQQIQNGRNEIKNSNDHYRTTKQWASLENKIYDAQNWIFFRTSKN